VYPDRLRSESQEATVKLTRSDLGPVLAIIAGGSSGAVLTAGLLLSPRSVEYAPAQAVVVEQEGSEEPAFTISADRLRVVTRQGEARPFRVMFSPEDASDVERDYGTVIVDAAGDVFVTPNVGFVPEATLPEGYRR
jgi:hypothetical protein